MNELQKMAFEILRQISEGEDALDKINKNISELFGHDPPSAALMPYRMRREIVSLIGKILEPGECSLDIASYFLYHVKDGYRDHEIKFEDGRTYLIKTLDDVKRYVEETQCP